MRAILRHIRNCFTIDTQNPDLVLAQFRAFTKQVPLLYLVLLANTGFVAFTHYPIAPVWLTVVIPGLFTCIAVLRLIGWWKLRNVTVTAEMATKRLHDTVRLSGVLSSGVAFWSYAIFPYGGAAEQTQVLFYVAFTMVACVFCLMHLRAAAFILATLVTIAFVARFGLSGGWITSVIGLNLVLVAGAMLFILSNNYEDFATMVAQKLDLEHTNRESIRLNAENTHLANCDALTGLPNRRSFFAEIDRRTKSTQGAEFHIGLLDLDGFKAVNDLYGHAVGDQLLNEASRRMQDIFPEDVLFARLGGDEFGFIAPGSDELDKFALSVCEALRQPYHLQDVTVEVSASCGIASYPSSAGDTSTLMEYADYALYHAKEHANGFAVVFNAQHRDEIRHTQRIEQCLRNANLGEELELHYQPIIDYRNQRLVGVEALARWKSPSLGQVAPGDFIAVAERSPLINKLTLVLLSKLLHDLQNWPDTVCVSFNLSARNLASPDTMLRIMAMLQASNVCMKRIEFEVTESAMMIDFDSAVKSLRLLRNMGASIALDDFGTGYSSLSHVHLLPLDKIKIDRRFIIEMSGSAKAKSIVVTIVDLTKNLNLKCVGEGIETQEQAEQLAACGCHLMQGYWFGKPMPAHEFQIGSNSIIADRKSA